MKHDQTGTQDAWARYGWLMGAIWLVFLFYPITALVTSNASLPLLVLGWCGVLGFAAAYLSGFIIGMRESGTGTQRVTLLIFWAALGCALLTTPAIAWAALSFLPFLMSYASYILSRPWHWALNVLGPVVVTGYVIAAGVSALSQPWGLMWIVYMIAIVNSINSWLIRRSARADELRFELATSEERESVARDVHDLLGHSLTVIKLKAELAARLVDQDPARARAELDEIVRLSSEAIAGVRGTVTGLRAESLAEQLLASGDALASAGIALEVRGSVASLSPAQSIPAAWILREATTNVLRHSAASRVRVELSPGTLIIDDNGRGVAEAESATGSGLRGMGERAAAAGAELVVQAASPRGTRVSLTW
ncbi:sensor histidine kinase [Leucobacter sp. BZR 635]